MVRGYSAVVARSLCMWKAPGSIPGISNIIVLSSHTVNIFWGKMAEKKECTAQDIEAREHRDDRKHTLPDNRF